MKEKLNQKSEKGMSIQKCVEKAKEYINENNECLFLFDVKRSGEYEAKERSNLQKKLIELISELNFKFDEYFPKNNLATPTREEKGFLSLLGDGSWVGINNSEVIPKIADYIKENYSDISFQFGVAKNGFDEEGLKIIR